MIKSDIGQSIRHHTTINGCCVCGRQHGGFADWRINPQRLRSRRNGSDEYHIEFFPQPDDESLDVSGCGIHLKLLAHGSGISMGDSGSKGGRFEKPKK